MPSFLEPTILAASLTTVGCGNLQLVHQLNSYEPRFTSATQEDTTRTAVDSGVAADGRPASLLSAFFGIDNGLPGPVDRLIHPGAAGLDGMPVIFSHEVDFATLQAGDLRVVRASGASGDLRCLTLAPADDAGELRTALLVGELGSDQDPPLRVEVVGDVLTIDGSANFRGASVAVSALELGPTLVWAEVVPESQWKPSQAPTPLRWGGGSGCSPAARQVVRVTWAGGVTLPGGDEVDPDTASRYRVTVDRPDGTTLEVAPFAIADLGDGDNNHLLCLDVDGIPRAVSFPAGLMTDPREDLNPATRVAVSLRP